VTKFQRKEKIINPSFSKVLIRCLLIALLLASSNSYALDIEPFLDDPLATRDLVSKTPAQSGTGPERSDACQTREKRQKYPLNLVDVIDQALCHHPQTRQAWANARSQAALLGQARAAYWPTINVTGSFSRSQNTSGSNLQNPVQTFGTSGTGTSGGSSSGQVEQTRISPTVSLNYLLFDFGGRAAKWESARRSLEAARWSHAATLQTVLFSAVQAYYQLFAANSALEAAEVSEHSSETALEAARFRYEIGAAALADQLQAQTAYAQAKLNRQQATGNASIALGNLANAMGLTPQVSLSIAPPQFERPDEQLDQDVQALIEQSKTLRPDLAAAEAQIRASESGVQAAKSANLPTLSLVGNYAYSYSTVFPSVQSWQVGLQINVPLFTGFANTYQIRNAEEQVEIQQANRDRLTQTVALDVWRAFYNLETTRETLHSTEELLASATHTERVALGRYQAGAGNILDLLNANASLANARFQRVQARYNWHIGKAQLAQAIGMLDLVELERIEGSSR
jgi:TolC family type I secretion outer membrane protein